MNPILAFADQTTWLGALGDEYPTVRAFAVIVVAIVIALIFRAMTNKAYYKHGHGGGMLGSAFGILVIGGTLTGIVYLVSLF